MADLSNSKAYTIIQHLTPQEWKRFTKYLESPYFNQSEEIIKFAKSIHKDCQTDKPPLSKEGLWKKVMKPKPYNDVRMRKFLSDLYKHVEMFLAQQSFESDTIARSLVLIDTVKEKKVDKIINSGIRSVKRELAHYPFRDPDFHYNQYKIEKKEYLALDYDTRRDEKSNLQKISDNLDLFYLSEKLRLAIAMLSKQNVVRHEYDMNFIEEITQVLNRQKHKFESIPSVSIYYQIYLMYKHPENEDHYFKLRKLLKKYGLMFPAREAQATLYAAAQNYCVRQINSGKMGFLNELFELYKDLLEKEIILEDGILSPWYYRNIVSVALRLGQLDWAEQFLENYKLNLPDDSRNNAYSFNLASLYFYQKKYEDVIDLLQEVEYEDLTYNLNSKVTLLFTYYEMDEIEPLYSLMESFRKYLNRHKDLPASRRRNYLNLIKYTKRLTNVMPGETESIEKLKKEISETKNIASANWLKEKLTELA